MSAYGLATKEEIAAGFASPGMAYKMDSEENYFNSLNQHFIPELKFYTTKFGKCEYELSWAKFRIPPVFRDKFIEKLSQLYPQYSFSQYEISGIWVEKKSGKNFYERAQSLVWDSDKQFGYCISPNYDLVNENINKLVELRNENLDNIAFVQTVNAYIKFIVANNFEKIKLPSDIKPKQTGQSTHSWAWEYDK